MFFYFLKIIFNISTSKQFKKYKPHSILIKNLKFKIFQKTGSTAILNEILVDSCGVLYEHNLYNPVAEIILPPYACHPRTKL